MLDKLAKYKQQSMSTKSPAELVQMLYAGAITKMHVAIDELKKEKPEFAKVNDNLIKTQNIFSYMRAILNDSYEISKQLDSLYDFFIRELIEANLKKDPSIIETVVELTTELKEAYQEANTNNLIARGS